MKVEIQLVHNRLTPEQKLEVVEFWVNQNALPEAHAKKRVDEVIFIARGDEGQIMGVSTIGKLFYEPIGQNFWYFRGFVAEKYRRQGIILQFISKAKEYLNDQFNKGKNPEMIGILVKVQNPILLKNLPQATWPRTQLHYVGQVDGCHIRISYFENAEIT